MRTCLPLIRDGCAVWVLNDSWQCEIFLPRITGKLDDFHSVKQRLGIVSVVLAVATKSTFDKIKRQFNKVIRKAWLCSASSTSSSAAKDRLIIGA
jgi:hypothetical protein